VLVLALAVVALSGCSAPGPVATVDGAAIERRALDRLHPSDARIDGSERASSLFLLILHHLLVTSAQREFAFSVSEDAQQAALAARIGRADADAALREQRVTRDRVRLEADLDVIRDELEERLVRRGASGLDLDAAYRTFLSTNARVCLSAVLLRDESHRSAVERLVQEGADTAAVRSAHPTAVEHLDMECATPAQFGQGLASVALDGRPGEAHVVETAGGVVVAAVDERDAPPPDAVREEVLEIAVETQGPELFNAWAADVIRHAHVEVDESVGIWAPAEGTGGVPTVVAS
jgi:hypothetical protein